MKRFIIALASTAALASPAFAQNITIETSCSDYMGLSSERQLEIANTFNESLGVALAQEIGETPGEKDADNRMRNIMAACENNPNGTIFQAVKESSGN